MTLIPNHEESLRFLETMYPTGPWLLTAIDPLGKGVVASKMFGRPLSEKDSPVISISEVRDSLIEWLTNYSNNNIYFAVNRPKFFINRLKTSKEEHGQLDHLCIDIDPQQGKTLEEEQTRILGMMENPPAGVRPPSMIVFSGGGYQAYWTLETPLEFKPEEVEDVERYGVHLVKLFGRSNGSDSVFNIDRVMRLPGTINWPNAKKQKRGQQPVVSRVHLWGNRTYPISEFVKEPLTSLPRGQTHSRSEVTISGNIPTLTSIEDIPIEYLTEDLKQVILNGRPEKNDNSAVLMEVVCKLHRNRCPVETIYSIITNKGFACSRHILKHKNWSAVAKHQIAKCGIAAQTNMDEELSDVDFRKMDTEYAAVLDYNGDVMILHEPDPSRETSESGGPKRSFIKPRNFFLRFQRRIVDFKRVKVRKPDGSFKMNKDGEQVYKTVNKALWWLRHPLRRTYDAVAFRPGEQTPPNIYNLWRGFACDAEPGQCSLLLEHILKNICSGDERNYNYLLDWMAKAVQRPGDPGGSYVVLLGGQGTGKSFFAKKFGTLFGPHFIHTSKSHHLHGKFSGHLKEAIVLFADEAVHSGDRGAKNTMKAIATESNLLLEGKGKDPSQARNCLHVIISSNEKHIVDVEQDDRRHFVLKVSSANQNNREYFERIEKEWSSGGMSAFLYLLLARDVSSFDPNRIPQTEELQRQKEYSRPVHEQWWFEKLYDGCMLPRIGTWMDLVGKAELTSDLRRYERDSKAHPCSKTLVVSFLEAVGCGVQINNQKEFRKLLDGLSHGRGYVPRDEQGEPIAHPSGWKFPSLSQARKKWDEIYGAVVWPKIDDTIPDQRRVQHPAAPESATEQIPF